jgi:hemerythrin-like domain-containing protein
VAAKDPHADLLARSQEFVDFFDHETINHFRQEEEIVFPLGVGDPRADPLLGQVMVEHLQLQWLVGELGAAISRGSVERETAAELAHKLERHIRFEEGELFPLLEEVVPCERLERISLAPRNRAAGAAS